MQPSDVLVLQAWLVQATILGLEASWLQPSEVLILVLVLVEQLRKVDRLMWRWGRAASTRGQAATNTENQNQTKFGGAAIS
jgi:hypothetical protein